MQWPRSILPVKTELLNLSQGGATYSYKLFQYRFNGYVQNDTMFRPKCTKNHANWFKYFEDVGSQT